MTKTIYSRRHERLLDLLREERRAAGLTQQQVATRLGKPQSYVAKYEGGERRLDVVEFFAVMEALGADPAGVIARLAEE